MSTAREIAGPSLPFPPRLLVTIAAGWALSVGDEQPAELAAGERAYQQLLRCDDYDVWLIHWAAGAGLEAHDHGDSAGALYVTRGELVEIHHDRRGSRVAPRRVGPRGARTFAVGDVHEVRNVGVTTASSVHVYSPPLTDMAFPSDAPSRHLRLVSSRPSTR